MIIPERLGVGGGQKAKFSKDRKLLVRNFPRGGGFKAKSFCGVCMDIFWNNLLHLNVVEIYCTFSTSSSKASCTPSRVLALQEQTTVIQ